MSSVEQVKRRGYSGKDNSQVVIVSTGVNKIGIQYEVKSKMSLFVDYNLELKFKLIFTI